MTIISPLEGGKEASNEEGKRAQLVVEGTIPIQAEFLFGAIIIGPDKIFVRNVDDAIKAKTDRKV